jgi:2-aminomuconate deaminase
LVTPFFRTTTMSTPASATVTHAVPPAHHSAKAAEPAGAYAHVRRAGNLLFLAGIGPRRRGNPQIPGVKQDASGAVIDYDITQQMDAAFDNVRTVLAECGATWNDIIDVTVFLTNMKRDWAAYNAHWAKHFPAGPSSPARTTVEITALPTVGSAPINFEIKVIAALQA